MHTPVGNRVAWVTGSAWRVSDITRQFIGGAAAVGLLYAAPAAGALVGALTSDCPEQVNRDAE